MPAPLTTTLMALAFLVAGVDPYAGLVVGAFAVLWQIAMMIVRSAVRPDGDRTPL